MSEKELFVIIGLEMSKKPVIDAGVTNLLLCAVDMERETAQMCMLEREMLGALEWLMDIDEAYVRLESEVARTAPCQFPNSTSIYSVFQVIHHAYDRFW